MDSEGGVVPLLRGIPGSIHGVLKESGTVVVEETGLRKVLHELHEP